jgi:GTP-binding protein LepA
MDSNIRNFVIMAHVDHGKSTLADRLLEITHTVEARKMKAQYLDAMELERERGITIKMAPVRMNYILNSKSYILNLIDTPGHSDFSYEVSRALAAVEGAILLVDATQGIQAQTIANYSIAKKLGLTIIPAINKIDLNPHVDDIARDVEELTGIEADKIFRVSGKTGFGVEALLAAVIELVPPPVTDTVTKGFRALTFDSLYDPHKGIIAFCRVMDGSIKRGAPLWLCAAREKAESFEVGIFKPELKIAESLSAGEIGYIALGVKDPRIVRIGDTITKAAEKESVEPLAGYKDPQPVVFASFYTQGTEDFDMLKNAVEKLHLTDASFTFEPESSEALGRGFRLGFLGTLHLEIIAERIKREFNISVITTAPSVAYEIVFKGGKKERIYKAQDFPGEQHMAEIYEPTMVMNIISRAGDYGSIMELSGNYRMIYEHVDYFGSSVHVRFRMPLAELLGDFYDRLKSVTSGFASVNYELGSYERADVVKMDILLADQEIPEFARILSKGKLEREARAFVARLKEVLPRENFAVAIQARAGGRIVARENLPAMKKDVTGYLYGGDRTRKMKLWKKQKEGKKKLLALARVNIPHDVYIKILHGETK